MSNRGKSKMANIDGGKFSRREFSKRMGGGLLGFQSISRKMSANRISRTPNVVIILSDDLGYGDQQYHGNPYLKTPNLDRLGTEGVAISHFYACPSCTASRAALLTGRWTYRTGAWTTSKGGDYMRLDEVTIAEMLGNAGYRTGIFGKWHLGEVYPYVPPEQGFEDGLYHRSSGDAAYFDPILEHNLQPVYTEGYMTDVTTDAAMRFVKDNRDKPFFLYLPFQAPHNPPEAPASYVEPYSAKGLDKHTATIYGMITCIDDNVGRLLKTLDDLNLTSDTIVIYLSDNGPDRGTSSGRYNCGLRGQKGSVYEGGIRVPFFIRWPARLEAGKKIETIPCANIDLLPTIAEACQVALPGANEIDGVSLLPLLTGEGQDPPDRLLFFHLQWDPHHLVIPKPQPNGAVRGRRYKLVNDTELYDMIEDPAEQTDIAVQNPDLVELLRNRYYKWWKDVTKTGFVVPDIPVGYPQENPSRLLAMDAETHGQIRKAHGYSGPGGTNPYFYWLDEWTNVDDFIDWRIFVERGGKYEVLAVYRCPKGDAGSRIRVSVGKESAEAEVPVPLNGESDWTNLRLGTLKIGPGKAQHLKIEALAKPGRIVWELKAVLLKFLD
jgi:arylsulfatase A